ncbi:MAG: DNA-processing protein DprA [bacterium]|nr:DNA-processing protein DprA [bacterium]
MSDHPYWLGFSLVPNIGPKRLLRLLQTFGDLKTAWNATEQDLAYAGLDETLIHNIQQTRRKLDLDAELGKIQRWKARLLTLFDEEYPPLLKQVDDAPPVLYIRGKLLPSDQLALGIVGTRKATQYGKDVAQDLSRRLAQHDVTIVSGLAQGIDSAAHQGAINGGGRTIAVLGCGVDIIYPREHRELALQIIEHGAIVSEFPIGMQPIANNFPRRNRTLSGMTLGVLVVEAPEGSGALITASTAAEQGREVFAVPGNIYSPMSRGTNHLIQDGAKLVSRVEDILDELQVTYAQQQTRTQTAEVVPDNPTEALLLEYLQADPIHVDDLARLCKLPITDVTSTLTILELKGLAQNVGLMQYSRTFDP